MISRGAPPLFFLLSRVKNIVDEVNGEDKPCRVASKTPRLRAVNANYI